jgi:hypothetical protein
MDMPYSSAAHIAPSPTFSRHRAVPDVPEDVDYFMEHLNDPNFDLKAPRHPSRGADSFELDHKKADAFSVDYSAHDYESHLDSDRYSTDRADSRISTALEFDE